MSICTQYKAARAISGFSLWTCRWSGPRDSCRRSEPWRTHSSCWETAVLCWLRRKTSFLSASWLLSSSFFVLSSRSFQNAWRPDKFTSIEIEEPLFVIAQDLDVLLQNDPEGLDPFDKSSSLTTLRESTPIMSRIFSSNMISIAAWLNSANSLML